MWSVKACDAPALFLHRGDERAAPEYPRHIYDLTTWVWEWRRSYTDVHG